MMWIYHSLFSYPPIEGHLGYFQFWAGVNRADINIHVQVFFCEHKFSFFWGKCSKVLLLGHILNVCLVY